MQYTLSIDYKIFRIFFFAAKKAGNSTPEMSKTITEFLNKRNFKPFRNWKIALCIMTRNVIYRVNKLISFVMFYFKIQKC